MRVAVPALRLAALGLSLTALLSAAPVGAADAPSADEVVHQMKTALEPPKPSVRTITMVFDDQGTKSTFGLVQARKKLATGAHALTVLLEPENAFAAFRQLITRRAAHRADAQHNRVVMFGNIVQARGRGVGRG